MRPSREVLRKARGKSSDQARPHAAAQCALTQPPAADWFCTQIAIGSTRTLSTAGAEHLSFGLRKASVEALPDALNTCVLDAHPMSVRLRPAVSNVNTRVSAPSETITVFNDGAASGSPAMLKRTS